MSDKRTAHRVALVAQIEAQAGGFPFIALAENVSSGGILIRTAHQVTEGEKLHLKFTLPGMDREIRVNGAIQHVSEGEFIGVRFEDLDPEDQKSIEKFIHKS